ncbi:MAG: hypothetical protein D6750_02065, partial [Bacteroidetes bacterium]
AFAVKGPYEAIERWQAGLPPSCTAQLRQPVHLYTLLYPDSTTSPPNGEALYFQRLPDRLHWIVYEG